MKLEKKKEGTDSKQPSEEGRENVGRSLAIEVSRMKKESFLGEEV